MQPSPISVHVYELGRSSKLFIRFLRAIPSAIPTKTRSGDTAVGAFTLSTPLRTRQLLASGSLSRAFPP